MKVGRAFEQELQRSLFGTWEGISSRDIFARIADERSIAILLDRRIDPSREMEITPRGTLLAAVHQIAQELSAGVSVADEVLYIGPPHATARLRTLIALREQELYSMSAHLPRGRYFKLNLPTRMHWQDLAEPLDLLADIERAFELTIHGRERIPHDLWAGATLPQVTAAEALSLVLIQFDLTFAWSDTADSVTLIPIPEHVVIERRHRPVRMQAADALETLQREFPQLPAERVGRELRVTATIEQHETVEHLLNPSLRAAQRPSEPVPLSRRRFTLNNRNFPVRDLMDKLELSGIRFEYDPRQLDGAGIKFDGLISIEADNATAEEFFRLVFEPLGLKAEIDGVTVTLVPR